MGVPAFFRWLSTKYPKIVSNVREEEPAKVDGEEIPVDITQPNPNGEEMDNLYLDMNNIVHPCFHPEDRPAPKTEEEIMLAIFKYIDRLVNMVRPRKLLFMAVDGVAPRAKMNQQRSRRFRSAQDAKEEADQKAEFRKILEASGRAAPKEEAKAEGHSTLDSNVITPGTPFMHLLSESLKYWVAYKINTDPGWARMKVIISDASVPGEGEHKMMEFIRSQRRSQEHDPNTRHVIYGLDADLIMLGLATHEPHFRILREDVFFQEGKEKRCRICNQKGHYADECKGEVKEKDGEFDEKDSTVVTKKPYLWLHVSVLREYLEIELKVTNQNFKFDLERAIDDYVFLCFFVGNDFLPHLPSLSIREEGIDTLVAVWKDNLPVLGGYLTTDGIVDLSKAQAIMDGLAKQEAAIFKRRRDVELRKEAGAKRRKLERERRNGNNNPSDSPHGRGAGRGNKRNQQENYDDVIVFAPGQANSREVRDQARALHEARAEIYQAQAKNTDANKSAAAILKETLLRRKASSSEVPKEEEDETPQAEADPNTPSGVKRKADDLEDGDVAMAADTEEGTPGRSTPINTQPKPADAEAPPDDVRLWDDGYEERYYQNKFGVDPNDHAFRHKVAAAYVEGVSWVLLYYMQGCPSWTWFYPYHYAPFAADFVDMAKMEIKFEKGTPFHPYEQLMGVLPAASNHAIPKPYRTLMEDPNSTIIDFYPEDFPLDWNGKPKKWMAIALLPFIDEKRLLDAMKTKEHLLTDDERQRNEFGHDILYFKNTHPMYEDIKNNFYSKKQGEAKFRLNPRNSDAFCGDVLKMDTFFPLAPLEWPFQSENMPSLPSDQSMSVYYEIPESTHLHKSQLLRGLNMPTRVLTDADQDFQRHRSNRGGRSHGGAPLRNDNGRGPLHYGNQRNNQHDPQFLARAFPNGPPPPPGMGGAPPPPPPWLAAQMGWVPGMPPPPPPQYQNQQYGGSRGGYSGGGGGSYGQGQGQNYQGHRNGGGDHYNGNGNSYGRGGRGGRGGGGYGGRR